MPGISYPQFPPGLDLRLEAVAIAAGRHKDFFDDPGCPYPPTLKHYLQKMVAEQRLDRRAASVSEEDANVDGVDHDKFDKMLKDLEKTIKNMDVLDFDVQSMEVSDRIQFIKAKTTLIEKWVNIKEKIFSLREIADFQGIIIAFLDTVLDKDQRKSFIDRLRALKSTENTAKGMQDDNAV